MTGGSILNFDFEIENMIIRQKQNKKNTDDFACSFHFKTSEWRHLEKYAIFWSSKEKSTIRYLGRNSKTTCPIPENILESSSFYIQVYANENVFTQKLGVSSYVHHKKKKGGKPKTRFDKDIDNIVYEDNKLLIYSNNKLIETIDIVDKTLLNKIVKMIKVPEQDVSGKEDISNKISSWSLDATDSHYPSEKLVKDALDNKEDKYDMIERLDNIFINLINSQGD